MDKNEQLRSQLEYKRKIYVINGKKFLRDYEKRICKFCGKEIIPQMTVSKGKSKPQETAHHNSKKYCSASCSSYSRADTLRKKNRLLILKPDLKPAERLFYCGVIQ